jgi:outer membrane lipoprotein-sorting protein
MTRRVAVAALLILLPCLPAFAATETKAPPHPSDTVEIQRIETYLNGIKTLRSQFLQVAQSGETAEGTILLKRPGKMKLDYAPPAQQMILASGSLLTYYDKAAKQTSHQDLDSSLAGILVRPQIRLTGGDLKVTGVSHAPGVARLRLVLAKDPDAGSIMLVFSDNPLELRQWVVVDPQGQSVQVTLMDAHFGAPIDDKEFYFVDPNSPLAPQLEQEQRRR